jgi:hypothetical protein
MSTDESSAVEHPGFLREVSCTDLAAVPRWIPLIESLLATPQFAEAVLRVVRGEEPAVVINISAATMSREAPEAIVAEVTRLLRERLGGGRAVDDDRSPTPVKEG